MKTISIKQLHQATGRFVREAADGAVYVTDHGTPVAVLRPFTEDDRQGMPFPRRSVADLPPVSVDSTVGISGERDAR